MSILNAAEQGPTRAAARIYANVDLKYWHHLGQDGDTQAASVVGNERPQPQRVIQATHGVRSVDVEMGSAIRYDIPGVNDDVGMVRKMRFDYDLQTVQITSYHVDHYSNTRVPPDDNPNCDEGPGLDTPVVDPT